MGNTLNPAPNTAIIKDDFDISQLIAYNLRRKGFGTELAFDGLEDPNKLKEEREEELKSMELYYGQYA